MPNQTFPGNFPAPGQPIDELALAEIKSAILVKLRLAVGKDAGMATRRDWYKAAALALRDRIVHPWLITEKQSYDEGRKRVRELRKYGAQVIKICATGGVFSRNTEPGQQQLSLEEMQAIVAEAHMQGLKVAAHAHGASGIRDAIRGQLNPRQMLTF